MSNQLEKLKNSIKKEYAKNFELNLMKTSGFIPVDKRQSEFFVIINKANVGDKDSIESVIKEKFSDLTPRFIPVEARDFDYLFNVVAQQPVASYDNNEQDVQEKAENSEPTAEEMLVSIGWLTKAQLEECISEANAKQVPLDAIFHQKEYLSYERIVSYLKKKYECEVVSK